MSRKRFAIIFTLFLSFASRSHATTVERLALEDLVKKSNKIVVGKVTNARTYWGGSNGKLILTTYTLEVEESIKGQPARTLELTTIGGKIGSMQLYVAGMVSFERGENAVVFIENAGPYSLVVGLSQGKFTVSNGEVSNNVSGLSFPDGLPGKNVKMPLETFKRQIKSLVRQF
jgi:hypothetical protein